MKKIILLCLACVFVASAVFAQSEDKKPQEGTPSVDIAAILLANDLAKYGYESNSAHSLIEAARILAQIPIQELAVEKTEKGLVADNLTDKAEKAEFTVENLLADAKELAGQNATLVAFIAEIEKLNTVSETATRGAVGGPKVTYERVYAHAADVYYIAFNGGVFAEVAVAGDGDTDLDLYIYDENGNLIVSDDDYSGNCHVSWVPRWTGVFKIRVVNRGGVYNNYGIATN